MNRIQISILSLLLLPGLAGCNDSKTDTAQSGGGTFAGLPGPKGEPGDKGPTGDKGEAGGKGEVGDAGANGDKGEVGDKGLAGDKGEVGEVGDKGEAGDKGVSGDKGSTGEAGDKGAAGNKGLPSDADKKPSRLVGDTPLPKGVTERPGGFDIQQEQDIVEVRVVAENALRVHYLPGGVATNRTIVVAESGAANVAHKIAVDAKTDTVSISTDKFTASWVKNQSEIAVKDPAGKTLTGASVESMSKGRLRAARGSSDALYGIGGGAIYDDYNGIVRTGSVGLNTGAQGHSGAPFVWSTAGYGILVDTVGAKHRNVNLSDSWIVFDGVSKTDVDSYFLVGKPAEIFGAIRTISGASHIYPKWSMGFTNSQWGGGINQEELTKIIDQYRDAKIPIDGFTFDLDWMFWGGKNAAGVTIPYSQFNWNTDKFPGGPTGDLKKVMDAKGLHLTAILKPRIVVKSQEGNYLTENNFWMPNSPEKEDHYRKVMMRHIDFGEPAVRKWYFDHLRSAFDTGIAGWWNDEADEGGDANNETEGPDMARAVYEGQRQYSNERVWSLNRNFYLGMQRYAGALWSGDIENGFGNMAKQRQNILSAINTGAMRWTMDTGGFRDRENPKIGTQYEDYARWVQFGIFTPIFRVHGEEDVKRQPWWYLEPGKTTAVSAIEAIRLRYKFIPYIYSYEHQLKESGVGLVRPLIFDWPNDAAVKNNVESWLFGEWLLSSPVVEQGQKVKNIYLPQGTWTNWNSGKTQSGGQTITFNAEKLQNNFPLFIRQGAIIPMMHEDVQYVGEKPLKELDVEVFPDTKRTSFEYYDDDGETYDYETGSYFLQTLSVERKAKVITFKTATPDPAGIFKPDLKYYKVKIHPGAHAVAMTLSIDGQEKRPAANDRSLKDDYEGWISGHDPDRGNIPVIYVRLKAQVARKVEITLR